MKRTFLYVSGDDYAALEFEQNRNPQEVYEFMLKKKITNLVIDDDFYAEVEIKEFDNVSDDFLNFIMKELCDYDHLKHSNIYEVKSK